jgi:tetratricopeptide (TPR) repeat protein
MGSKLISAVLICFVGICLGATTTFGDGTNALPTEKSQASETDSFWAQHVVESYQQLQAQQDSMMRDMEQARQQAEVAAKRNADELEARLGRIEQSVSSDHEREIEGMQNTHRFTLIVVGACAAVGFLGMLLFAVFLLRMMNRRTETMIAQFAGQLLGTGPTPAALGNGDTQVVVPNRVEQSTTRFLNTIERLEQRIHDLEDSSETVVLAHPLAKKSGALPSDNGGNGNSSESTPATEEELAEERARNEKAERDARIALLLGKGQAHLNLQQADTALNCFNEVLELEPTNAEAAVKKGMALEKLGSLEEAIDCYNRAIALDNSMTMAYLNKGGVFNRLERYGEALQCYELALRAQQKPSVA